MSLVHRQETILFPICLAFSVAIILYVLVAFSGGLAWTAVGVFTYWALKGWSLGHIRGNGVRVSPHQFGEVYRLAQRTANDLGLKRLPPIYVYQVGGALNAFAARSSLRTMVVIYSDMLELAYREGESELGFVLAHELAHVKRKHLQRRLLIGPALAIPFLGQAYSRGCEYTCDRIGAHHHSEGAIGGLLVLAAGKRLYRNVSVETFSEQVRTERGFWVRTAELLSSHPILPKRVAALRRFAEDARPLPQPELSPTSAPALVTSSPPHTGDSHSRPSGV